jgi:hypothetical protein
LLDLAAISVESDYLLQTAGMARIGTNS